MSDDKVVRPEKVQQTNVIYYKVKLYSSGGRNPTKLMQKMLRTWFKTIKMCSNSFVVYEFCNNARTRAIQLKTDINANLQFLKRFFSGLRLKTIPGDVWFTVLVGYNESEEDFKDNTDWWYRDNNSGIFKLTIQAPDMVRDIWLFLSHQKIDLAKLTEAIIQEAKTRSIEQVPFALIFSNVKDGKKYDATKKSADKQAKAIHVEVTREHALTAQTMFSNLYSSTAVSFPLGMWMHYALTPSPTIMSVMRDGALALRNKQVWVPEIIGHGQSWDILNLDKVIKSHKISAQC